MKLGLFQQLLLHLLLLLILVLASILVVTHVFQQEFIDRTMRADLENEARWIAQDTRSPSFQVLAARWRTLEPYVDLSVIGADGRILAASRDAATPGADTPVPSASRLITRVPIRLGGVDATLVLAARRTPAFAPELQRGFLLWIAFAAAVTSIAVVLLVGRVTRGFERLSVGARRIADGRYDHPIQADGPHELRALIASFNDMAARLQSEEQRKRRLIADVSHELRSPLGRLRALGETIIRRPREAAPHLHQLQSEITLMDRLIQDMLMLARFELGAATLSHADLPLKDWAELVLSSMRVRIEQAGIACRAGVPVDSGIRVSLDPDRMIQVFGNLVDNAIAATAGQHRPCITLSIEVMADAWQITVEDNGAGINPADLPYIFDRFFRVDNNGAREPGNAGLGLSIARAIVEAHRGEIRIESALGQGTRVRAVLPLRPIG